MQSFVETSPGQLPNPETNLKPELASEVWGDLHSVGVKNAATHFTDDELADEQRQIVDCTLSPWFAGWVRDYEAVGARGGYLWKWCLQGMRPLTLSCVAPDLREHVIDTKMLAVLFGVLLDDIADRWQDRVFLNKLIAATFEMGSRDFQRLEPGYLAYAEFTCQVWDEFQSRVTKYPLFESYRELLNYDNRQIVNAMVYSQLVNEDVNLLNLEEHDVYSPHNMQMISFATMDLMCSPSFDVQELGRLRGAMWHAQSMGRIGNLISTWERELLDRDYSSGVFAVLTDRYPEIKTDMLIDKPDVIHSILKKDCIEEFFLERWSQHRDQLKGRVHLVRSADLEQFLDGLDRLLRMEIASRGRK